MELMIRRISVVFLLFFLCSQVTAQFKNSKLDESNVADKAIEPSIAINKKDQKYVVAVSSPDNVYYTVDGGLSWRKSNLSFSSGISGHMMVVSDNKDNFYIVHRTTLSGAEHLVSHHSSDGGKTWSEGSLIDDQKETMSKDQRWQHISTDAKGNLYAAWTQSDNYGSADTTCHSGIYYSQSSNGRKWSTPVKISTVDGHCKEDDFMAAGASCGVSIDGKVYVLWANGGKLFFDRSFNGGGMWLSTDLPIVDQPGGWAFNVPGQKRTNGLPTFTIDYSKGPLSGSLAVCWADQRNGATDTDVWFTRSHNGGDNWTSPVRLSNDEKKRHQYSPAMAVDQSNGIIYIAYYNRQNYDDLQTDVYLAYSIDGGNKFESVKISETPFTPADNINTGDYIGIAAHKGVVTAIWTRVDEGKTSIWTTTLKQDDLIPQAAKK